MERTVLNCDLCHKEMKRPKVGFNIKSAERRPDGKKTIKTINFEVHLYDEAGSEKDLDLCKSCLVERIL